MWKHVHYTHTLESVTFFIHHEIQVTPDDFELLPRVVWQMDRPVGDALIIELNKIALIVQPGIAVIIDFQAP